MFAVDSIDVQVRQVCNGHGVGVIAFGGYRSFALQVGKSQNRAGGEDLSLVVNVLVERYAKLGLDPKVLWSIASEVFNVRPPLRG